MTESELDSAASKYVSETDMDLNFDLREIFKAGAQLILKTHVPKEDVQILLDAMVTAQKFMFEHKYYNYDESELEFQMIRSIEEALESYQAKRGEKWTKIYHLKSFQK